MTGDFVLPIDPDPDTGPQRGEGVLQRTNEVIDFAPNTSLPAHLFHWRLPVEKI